MPRERKRKRREDALEPYRRLRKPMPPPQRVLPDRRRKLREKQAESEAGEEEGR